MAIYQVRTFSDIYSYVMEQIKLQSTDTVSKNRIKRDINNIYLNEVAPYCQWRWLRGYFQVAHEPVVTAGTVTATQGSTTITFTVAPTASKTGHNLKLDGFNEIYRIAAHTGGSTSAVLSTPYLGTTASAGTYKLWNDRIVLPVDLRETFEVTQYFDSVPMEGKGLQEFRRFVTASPFAEGRPRIYSTSDFIDPDPYAAITSLPALSTRASTGLVRTLTFASNIEAVVFEGDRVQVSLAGDANYNGTYVISSVSGAAATYTASTGLTESATADATLTLKRLSNEKSAERYRELYVFPSITTLRTTLNIDYIKEPTPLENDSDEPAMPISDRSVLAYGALWLAWDRERNKEQSDKYFQIFQNKLAKMAGKVNDSTDLPVLMPGKTYLAAKRFSVRTRDTDKGFPGWGGGSTGSVATGTPNRAAIFGSDGVLIADSLISTTELEYLNNVDSAVLGQSQTGTFTNKTIDADSNTISNIDNNEIKAAAGINVNKLEALTASRAVVSDGSGFISSSAITSTEVTYLDDVEPLTSFAMNDNQAAAANVATWAHASFSHIELLYSISRGAGNVEGGMITIVTDGTSAGIATSGAAIGSSGVTFSADVSGSDVRLRYVSTSTGTAPTMKYKTIKWLA